MDLHVQRGQVTAKLRVSDDELVKVGPDGTVHRKKPLRATKIRQERAGEPRLVWNGWPYVAVDGVEALVGFLEHAQASGAATVEVRGVEPSTEPSRTASANVSAAVTNRAPDRAVAAARFTEVCAYLFGIFGVVLGLAIAVSDRMDSDSIPFLEQYPNLIWGLLTSLVAAFQAAIVVMVSAYIQARLAAPDGVPSKPPSGQ